MTHIILSTIIATSLLGVTLMPISPDVKTKTLATREISLEKRYEDRFVNGVFKDNILLNIAYLRGMVKDSKSINWDTVRQPFSYEFTLKPSESFAFHEDVFPELEKKVVKTTNAHFNFEDGFLSDGYLMGDGVCHLASLLYWVAKDAGLNAVAPTNHDFMKINEIPKEYGVSIYFMPGQKSANARQNMYIENTFEKPISIVIDYNGEKLKVSVFEED